MLKYTDIFRVEHILQLTNFTLMHVYSLKKATNIVGKIERIWM